MLEPIDLEEFEVEETSETDSKAWRVQAACRGLNPGIFFPASQGGRNASNSIAAQYREAKKICSTCPVILPCRDEGLQIQDPYGMYGGMTPGEIRRYNRGLKFEAR